MAATETLTMHSRVRPAINIPTTHARNATISNDDSHASSSAPAGSQFQRSASYTYLPDAHAQYLSSNLFTPKGTFTEEDLIVVPEERLEIESASSGYTTPDELDVRLQHDRLAARDIVLGLQSSAKLSVQRLADQEEAMLKSSSSSMLEKKSSISQDSVSSANSRARAQRSSTSTTASRKLKRKSWYSIATTPDSRSPSPGKRVDDTTQQEEADAIEPLAVVEEVPGAASSKRNSYVSLQDFTPVDEPEDFPMTPITPSEEVRPSTSRRSSIFRRPLSGIFGRSSDAPESPAPAMPSIPKSFSTDRLPSLASEIISANRAAVPPRIGVTEKTQPTRNIIRKKDELWSVFRALDADHAKFVSKSVAFKANVVRSGLIPFLRTYANHPSTNMLRPEDLDRRANILNKWWTALIEMLHGRNNQSISGTDRPAILDGIAGIMERPEWRLFPSPFCPLTRRMKDESHSRSTTSLSSLASDFLTDSVHQNVRNIFVQNLRSQMAFVVDKMSLRNASASLVTFCGKACAYAFMFVPGMADVLVRLWDLQSDTLRRVLSENGLERFGNLSTLSDDIITRFPPCLGNLAFSTLADFNRKLRTPPPLPTGTTNIQWWGYWLERWTGRESDLFYVFVKHYHILVSEFLPPGSTREERMCIPGMLLVHGQILTNLDATIHRQAGRVSSDIPSNTPAIDDTFADPDAIASTLPVPPINAVRHMQENRLIMLIRDFLSERAADHPDARQIFAESFYNLLQAATRGVCLYDPASCYTLLDLLEEALVIIAKYEQISLGTGSIIDPDFWQLVSRRMIASENTLTEIRLYAFLYTIWNSVTCDLRRKSDLCVGLLLDPAMFASRFNHWSPMVRAYYMRLLCWRVGRYDGDPQPGDFDILETLLKRLQTTWSHYLWLRDEAIEVRNVLPQTSPCNPAPNRRLRIVRIDTNVPPPGAFPSFDVIVPPMVSPARTSRPKSRHLSTLTSVAELETRARDAETGRSSPDSDSAPSSPTGIKGLFTKVSSRSRSKSQSSGSKTPTFDPSTPLPRRGDNTPALLRAATSELLNARERSESSSAGTGSTTPTTTTSTIRPPHRNFSFKFAMEYSVNIKQPGPLRLIPPRLAAPAQKLLNEMSELPNSPLYMRVLEPTGIAKKRVTYTGRALAEWALIVGECQSFFDRRRNEGVPDNKQVETPTLGVEVFKRPG